LRPYALKKEGACFPAREGNHIPLKKAETVARLGGKMPRSTSINSYGLLALRKKKKCGALGNIESPVP